MRSRAARCAAVVDPPSAMPDMLPYLGSACTLRLLERGHGQTRGVELVPIMFGEFLVAGEDDRLAGVVDPVCDRQPLLQADSWDGAREGARDVLEGVVVVVTDDDAPSSAEPALRAAETRSLDGL